MKSFDERSTFASAAPPEATWRAAAEAGALEPDAGFTEVEYRREDRGNGAGTVAVGRGSFGPFRLEWDEPAWNWEAPRRLTVERRFRRGPFARFTADTTVVADGRGSRVEHVVTLDANGMLGALLAPLVLARLRRAGDERFAHALGVASVASSQGSATATARFADALEQVRPHHADDPAIAARLAAAAGAGGVAASALRPFALADAWSMPRDRVLAAMLAGAREGLLDYAWQVTCASCGGVCGAVPALDKLTRRLACEDCVTECDVELDSNVEIVFDARAAARGAHEEAAATPRGPRLAARTRLQNLVVAHASVALETQLAPGPHAIRAGASETVISADPSAATSTLSLTIRDDGIAVSAERVRPGTVRVEVVNESAHDAVVRLIERARSDDAATAAAVSAQQAFRDLFPAEAPADNVEFPLRELTFVFADVAGSAQLYAEHGDIRALRLIADQIDALHDLAAAHRGAIVKTIGETAMVVFADPADAVRALLAFVAGAPLPVRAGAHTGPCVALRANERLDYAGAAVGLAARVARVAANGELLFTGALAGDPRVTGTLRAAERGTLTLRGAAEPLAVVRVRVVDAAG